MANRALRCHFPSPTRPERQVHHAALSRRHAAGAAGAAAAQHPPATPRRRPSAGTSRPESIAPTASSLSSPTPHDRGGVRFERVLPPHSSRIIPRARPSIIAAAHVPAPRAAAHASGDGSPRQPPEARPPAAPPARGLVAVLPVRLDLARVRDVLRAVEDIDSVRLHTTVPRLAARAPARL